MTHAVSILRRAQRELEDIPTDAWDLHETAHSLALMTGRLLACKVARSKVRVSVIGPIADEVRATLGAEVEDDWEFKKVQGGLLLTFPVERSAAALALLKDGFNSFVDMATARVRRTVSLEGHVPEAVAYVASVVGRELPQPKQSRSPDSDADTDKECGVCSDPLHDATLPPLAASAQHMAQGAICRRPRRSYTRRYGRLTASSWRSRSGE